MNALGTAQVIRANSRNLPIADNSVDLVVTSPPYFALRSYQDGGEHYAGQIGDEPTPDEFVSSLLEVTAECVRALKPSGSLWVNLGDKYAGSAIPRGVTRGYDERTCPSCERVFTSGRNKCHKCGVSTRMAPGRRSAGGPTEYVKGAPPKSLIGIPWRYALRCIDELGLILRAEVIWSKPNGLPESVTDRVRRSHEQWFHFTLSPRYFSAVDEIREAHLSPVTIGRRLNGGAPENEGGQRFGADGSRHTDGHPLGKLPGSVWTVPTEPLRVPDHLGVDHFAAFPTEWPKRIIQGWSPAGVCVECGEGRRPVTTAEIVAVTQNRIATKRHAEMGLAISDAVKQREITGYACACPEPTAPTRLAVVLDPFGGTGTTAMVAKALGRHGISVDMSADYCRLAEWRTNDRNQLAKVLGLAKTDAPDPDQLDLFGDGAA